MIKITEFHIYRSGLDGIYFHGFLCTRLRVMQFANTFNLGPLMKNTKGSFSCISVSVFSCNFCAYEYFCIRGWYTYIIIAQLSDYFFVQLHSKDLRQRIEKNNNNKMLKMVLSKCYKNCQRTQNHKLLFDIQVN